MTRTVLWSMFCSLLLACSGGSPFRAHLNPGDDVWIDPTFTSSERETIFVAIGRWALATDGCVHHGESEEGYPIYRRDLSSRTNAHTDYVSGWIALDPGLTGSYGTRTVMHELGHAYGLSHECEQEQDLMCPSGRPYPVVDDRALAAFNSIWECP